MVEETRHTEQWTYLGAEWDYDDRQLHYIYQNEAGEEKSYKRQLTRPLPGGVFVMTIETDTGSVFYKGKNTPVYQHRLEDSERVAVLEANNRSALAVSRMSKKAKSDMADSQLVAVLRPLSAEYYRRDRTGRAAFLATIIETITRG